MEVQAVTTGGFVGIIHGPQCSGKDIHSEAVATKYAGVVISSGAVLRRHGSGQTAAGLVSNTGDFQLQLELAIRDVPAGQPIILAGVTRKPGEPVWLLDLLTELHRPLIGVVRINVDDDICLSRTREGSNRPDDDPAVQAVRLQRYHDETEPTLATYPYLGIPVLPVDGNSDIVSVGWAVETGIAQLLETAGFVI